MIDLDSEYGCKIVSACMDNIDVLREWKKSNFSDHKPKNISKHILDFYKDRDNAELIENCITEMKENGFIWL